MCSGTEQKQEQEQAAVVRDDRTSAWTKIIDD